MANSNIITVLKINNSYDSEPSTGSGSSLSENNDKEISDEENMNLPYLLKPTTVITDNALTPQSQYNSKISSLRGSQESPFMGFGDSPYGNINKGLYGSQLQNLKLPEPQQNSVLELQSAGQAVFPRFYDTIMEENSCNAVDLPLQNEQPNNVNPDIAQPLTFNGKIESLTKSIPVEAPPTTSENCTQLLNIGRENTSQKLTESFSLNKYKNECSPDIFADSDEENDNQTDNGLGSMLEDVIEVLEESNCMTEVLKQGNSERLSLTVPTETSFVDEQTLDTSATQTSTNGTRSHFLENCRRERELYKRIKRCLQGVRPPPSVTTPDLDLVSMVVSKKSDILNFLLSDGSTPRTIEDSGICTTPSLFKPSHSLAEAQNSGWRDVLSIRQHGLSYNLNKAAEQNEYLSLSVVERYVGMETATSYVRSPSSAKKRNMRMKMLTQSPGNRLSHLAKRRAIFSSANLATNSIKLNSSMGPQILLDKKKLRNKRKATPKRKTPGSKKKARKTPSSSARKQVYQRADLIKPGPSRESSKRALFQSPAKGLQQREKLLPPKPIIKPEIANRVEKSKRALFSPETQNILPQCSNELESLLKRKRNANDDDDAAELASQSSKLFRASNSSLTPRALKIKSQSFCIGAGSSTMTQPKVTAFAQQQHTTSHTRLTLGLSGSSSNLTTTATPTNSKLQRAYSEMSATPQCTMTDNQRKKLLWAVSQALQEKKITAKHEHFRQHAADLARIVKRVFQEFYLGHTTSNSETLLRLAKKYAYGVISGKNADDIYLLARSQEYDAKRQSVTRLSGYIGPEEFEQRKQLLSQTSSLSQQSSLPRSTFAGSMQNIFVSENSIDSIGLSQISHSISTHTQSSLMERISEDLFCGQGNTGGIMPRSSSKQQPIQPNATLQNSSSKSNLGGLALRENVDCEQRRSTQKNFTGKDQRNISPYYGTGTVNSNSNSSALKVQAPLTANAGGDSGAKAKRQISFDS